MDNLLYFMLPIGMLLCLVALVGLTVFGKRRLNLKIVGLGVKIELMSDDPRQRGGGIELVKEKIS